MGRGGFSKLNSHGGTGQKGGDTVWSSEGFNDCTLSETLIFRYMEPVKGSDKRNPGKMY